MPFPYTGFGRNLLLGTIKLQSNDTANVFYSDEIQVFDSNYNYPDWAPAFFQIMPNQTLVENVDEFVVDLSGENTILQGYYVDNALSQRAIATPYNVLIYLWYEVEEDEKP